MDSFDFVNEETGVPFRVRIVRRGETYGRGARHNRDEPLVEFYDQRRALNPKDNGLLLVSIYADQMLRRALGRLTLYGSDPQFTITAANCEQISAWLRTEIDKPWVPLPPPPRPMPNTPTGPIKAGSRRATIFLGTTKHEVTWLEVSVAPDAQYQNAYHIQFKPKRARTLRKYVEHSRPRTVIVEGWGHPEFESITASLMRGASKDAGEVRLAQYLESLPLSQILLDTRGVIIDEIAWIKRPPKDPEAKS
jgi:hypothetical protein